MIKKSPRNISHRLPFGLAQFLKFSIVGTSNSLIHYLVFLLFLNFFGLHYIMASCAGYAVGLINSFIWNGRWTFRLATQFRSALLFKFVSVNLFAFSINLLFLYIFVNSFMLLEEISQIFAIGFSTVINFLGNKYWTFLK